jgi:heme a synthase
MRTFLSKAKYQKFNLATIVLLFVLILAGGVVRSTGSGMGCPDWPKCFGQYVPPTNISQLPKDYKSKYVNGRLAKNQRFAKVLDFFGYAELARRIRGDKSILVPEEFNPFKTWTEYVNRLIGAISGILLLLTAIYSFSYKKENKWIPILSVINVVLVGYQAWLGSIVVSTNLVPTIVTIHMVLAIAILALSIGTFYLSKVIGRPKLKTMLAVRLVCLAALVISIIQIIFGTEVRERIDEVATRLQGDYREEWIGGIGSVFYTHRTIAVIVVVLNALLFWLIRKSFNKHSIQQQIMSFSLLIMALQIVTGVALAYWDLPPVAQALHIVLSSLMFGAQCFLLLNLYKSVSAREAVR